MVRKRRTRQHVIADLSANHVERQVLRCGFSLERIIHDYGLDLVLFTYDANGEIENGQVYIQLKASDAPRILKTGDVIALAVRRSDLELWLREPMPYILVVYHARADVAYWLYVQAYFENLPDFDLSRVGASITVRVPLGNIVDTAAVKQFARFKDAILVQAQEVFHHDG